MEKETSNESLALNPNPDVFVPQGEEKRWCEEQGFEFRELDNGIIILGVPRQVSDMAQAEIEFTFPAGGASFDPVGQSGLHHLTEHLINTSIRNTASPFGVKLNASTGTRLMREVLEGAAPMSTRDKLGWMTTGWSKWRRLIDGEKIIEVGSKIRPEDLLNLYDDIMNTDPAVLLIGDLN